MKAIRQIMDMPVTIDIPGGCHDECVAGRAMDDAFAFFEYVDDTFSTYKPGSEISRINQGLLAQEDACEAVKHILALAEETRTITNGYFDISRGGVIDPSGLVKGWAIYNAALMIRQRGLANFYVDAGGDIQASGANADGNPWRVGIRNPFNVHEVVKTINLRDAGIATSGTYARGSHIYDPTMDGALSTSIVSLTVVGPDVYEADRFATAAFAMGEKGVEFIERLVGFEAYQISASGTATFTSGFQGLVAS